MAAPPQGTGCGAAGPERDAYERQARRGPKIIVPTPKWCSQTLFWSFPVISWSFTSFWKFRKFSVFYYFSSSRRLRMSQFALEFHNFLPKNQKTLFYTRQTHHHTTRHIFPHHPDEFQRTYPSNNDSRAENTFFDRYFTNIRNFRHVRKCEEIQRFSTIATQKNRKTDF